MTEEREKTSRGNKHVQYFTYTLNPSAPISPRRAEKVRVQIHHIGISQQLREKWGQQINMGFVTPYFSIRKGEI